MFAKPYRIWLWGIAVVVIIYRIINSFSPMLLPGMPIVLTIFPFIFALLHGTLTYRLRDILVFLGLTLVVSNILENLSILTGFPFGHYHYTNYLGPKLFLVPVLIGLAYFGMGYLSWMLARLILGKISNGKSRHAIYTVPLLASFLMVSWDLTFDPLASTVSGAWIWEQGGSYFGVPLTNFIGWYFTVYIFYQLFALYLKSQEKVYAQLKPEASRAYWLQAVFMYGITGLSTVLSIFSGLADQTFTDAAGVVWHLTDVINTCALAALFTMIPFTLISLVKTADLKSVEQPDAE
jgi:uncharacterized membrane protein